MKKIIMSVTLLFLAACVNKPEANGYSFENIEMNKLQVGNSNYQQVLQVMGSPSVQSSIDKEWIYYSDTTEKVMFFKTMVVDRKIVVVKFDNSGIVREIKNYSKNDGQEIRYVADSTRVQDKKFSIWQQMIGNLGIMSVKGSDGNVSN